MRTEMPDPTAPERCRSWRIRGWRIVRCTRPRDHADGGRWHYATRAHGQPAWLVKDRERNDHG